MVTGGEALYADMGHFGKRPIRLAWFAVVLPALVLNYFGQGGMLLANPAAATQPVLWTGADLGALPHGGACDRGRRGGVAGAHLGRILPHAPGRSARLQSPGHHSAHLADRDRADLLPGVNRTLGIAVSCWCSGSGTRGNLASAYGIAVTGTMTITTVLFCAVARERWNWSTWRCTRGGRLFLAVDLSFLGANLVKIAKGGWFPLVVALGVFTLMTTWKRGEIHSGADSARDLTPDPALPPGYRPEEAVSGCRARRSS